MDLQRQFHCQKRVARLAPFTLAVTSIITLCSRVVVARVSEEDARTRYLVWKNRGRKDSVLDGFDEGEWQKEFCMELLTSFDVVPFKTWGLLSTDLRKRWGELNCNNYVTDKNGQLFGKLGAKVSFPKFSPKMPIRSKNKVSNVASSSKPSLKTGMPVLKAYGVKKGEPWRMTAWEPAEPIPEPVTCNDTFDLEELRDLTLVSVLSADRVPSLHHFLEGWDGPVSLAMIVPNMARALELGKSVLDLQLENGTAVPVPYPERITLTVVEDVGYMCPNRVPTNKLRNLAVRNALNKYMLMLDIDFSVYPQKRWVNGVIDAVRRTKGLCISNRAAIVLPAFETDNNLNEIDHGVVPDKARLMELIGEQHIRQFHYFYPPGHGPSQYSRWKNATSGYRVGYEFGYEPYFIIRRDAGLPPFDESFVGKGMNKVAWCNEVAAAGFQFWVAPETFVMHKNHATQESLGETCDQPVIRGNNTYKLLTPIGFSCLRKFDKKLETLYGYKGAPVVYKSRKEQLRRADEAFPGGCVTDDPLEPKLPQPQMVAFPGLQCGHACTDNCPPCPASTQAPCNDLYCRGGS